MTAPDIARDLSVIADAFGITAGELAGKITGGTLPQVAKARRMAALVLFRRGHGRKVIARALRITPLSITLRCRKVEAATCTWRGYWQERLRAGFAAADGERGAA